MTNVVDIKEPAKAKSKKKTYKEPSKAQIQRIELMQTVSGISAILKQEGDCAANGTNGKNAMAWWHKGDLIVFLEVCKHDHVTVGINSEHMKDTMFNQLVGFCAINAIEWEAY